MKKIPVESAVGMELCHDITAMRDGFKGAAFKRGHIITEEDVPKLLDIGKKNVFVWEDNAGEIHEEEAAPRGHGTSQGNQRNRGYYHLHSAGSLSCGGGGKARFHAHSASCDQRRADYPCGGAL